MDALNSMSTYTKLRVGLFVVISIDLIYFVIWFALVRYLIVDTTIFLGVVCGLAWCAGYACIFRDSPAALISYFGIAVAATFLLLGAFFWGLWVWESEDSKVNLGWHFAYYLPSLIFNITEVFIAYKWWRLSSHGDYEDIGGQDTELASRRYT